MPDLDRVTAGLRCRDILTLLPDYVDRELEATEVSRVDAHLSGCSYCAKFGGEYGVLAVQLKRYFDEPALDSEARSRLTRRLEQVWSTEAGDNASG